MTWDQEQEQWQVQELATPGPLDHVIATRVDVHDFAYIMGHCEEHGVTVAEFLRCAAVEAASR